MCHGATEYGLEHAMTAARRAVTRVDWVDYAKGICICLVVLMHSTLGVEKAMGSEGGLHQFIDWARPFRMPDFFLISGLFLSRRITAPWREYLDSKVVHFVYFYLLWMGIQFATKGYGFWLDGGLAGLGHEFALAFVEPYGTLWFIYLLPVFFVTVRVLQPLPPLLIFGTAALLQMLQVQTGWIVIDEFCARLVYFYAGVWLAPLVFRFATAAGELRSPLLLAALALWAVGHTLVFLLGFSATPGVGLVLGFIGTGAVIAAGVLLARFKAAQILRVLGENSIVVYLSFFLFMAASRSLVLRLLPGLGSDAISLIVTLCGIAGPMLMFLVTRETWLAFLFRRPRWAKLETAGKVWHSGGHEQLLKPPHVGTQAR
jgi:uncharacterized membrane protein YcfT